MSDFSVTGADTFFRLSKALKAAGRTELRKELTKGMRDAAKPLIPKVRESAGSTLPQRGGLAARIARKPYRVKVSTSASNPGVSIVGTKVDPRINQGRVFHPVFGHKPGVVQSVTPGYFDKPLEASGPDIRPALEQAIERVADKIVNG